MAASSGEDGTTCASGNGGGFMLPLPRVAALRAQGSEEGHRVSWPWKLEVKCPTRKGSYYFLYNVAEKLNV